MRLANIMEKAFSRKLMLLKIGFAIQTAQHLTALMNVTLVANSSLSAFLYALVITTSSLCF